jgi:hypothetical protein
MIEMISMTRRCTSSAPNEPACAANQRTAVPT